MKTLIIALAANILAVSALAQTTVPEGFSAGSITTGNATLTGFVKEDFKKSGGLIFVDASGKKSKIEAGEVLEANWNGTKYTTRFGEFYKQISTGQKLNLYQKISDQNGKIIYNGANFSSVVNTEGSVGDYFIQSPDSDSWTLIKKKTVAGLLEHYCKDCPNVSQMVKAGTVTMENLSEAVRQLNLCN